MVNCRCAGPDIVPGATFDQRFIIPIPAYQVVGGEIIYQQKGEDLLTLEIGTDATVEEIDYKTCAIVVPFAQGRSLVFEEPYPAECQINLLTVSGARVVTGVIALSVGTNMDMEIMTGGDGNG